MLSWFRANNKSSCLETEASREITVAEASAVIATELLAAFS